MKRTIALSIVLLAIIFSTSAVVARELPTAGTVEKNMFKNMVQGYLHPSINGWGIGLNTVQDSYLISKFVVVTVRQLPTSQIVQIIKESKTSETASWTEVKDRIKTALDSINTTKIVGRIKINKNNYILTGVIRSDTTFSGDIRTKPDYSACASVNITNENCELQSTKVGDLSLTRKSAELETGKDRVWAGTMNFNNTAYTFVAIVNPQLGD